MRRDGRPGRPLDETDRALLAEYQRNASIAEKDLAAIIGLSRRAILDRRKNPRFIQAQDEMRQSAAAIWERSIPGIIRRVSEHIQARGTFAPQVRTDEKGKVIEVVVSQAQAHELNLRVEDRSARVAAVALGHIIPRKVDLKAQVTGVVGFAEFMRDVPEDGKVLEPVKVKAVKRKGGKK